MRFLPLLSAAVLALASGLATAAMPNAKPGLWESVTTTASVRECVSSEMAQRWDGVASAGTDSSTKLDLQLEARWLGANCGALKLGERLRLGGS